MPTRTSEAEWRGNLTEGKGTMKLGSGAYSGAYDWRSRSGDGAGTNPEEMIAAAHAGCFSMALGHELAEAGTPAQRIHTVAKVSLEAVDGGFAITQIHLDTEGEVKGIDAETFKKAAESAKTGCPVSKALAGTQISLKATLL